MYPPIFQFSLSPLILSMIISITSWGHLGHILGTYWWHLGDFFYFLLSERPPRVIFISDPSPPTPHSLTNVPETLKISKTHPQAPYRVMHWLLTLLDTLSVFDKRDLTLILINATRSGNQEARKIIWYCQFKKCPGKWLKRVDPVDWNIVVTHTRRLLQCIFLLLSADKYILVRPACPADTAPFCPNLPKLFPFLQPSTLSSTLVPISKYPTSYIYTSFCNHFLKEKNIDHSKHCKGSPPENVSRFKGALPK